MTYGLDRSTLGSIAIQAQTVPFTTPPVASNWILAAASTGALSPVDVTGAITGVQFTATNGGSVSVATKALASPGGSHVVTMFVSAQIQPASNVDNRAYLGMLVMGTSNCCEVKLAYDGDGTGPLVIGTQFPNNNYFAGSNLGFPWTLYKGGYPFSGAWWRLTFDNSTVFVERNQVGGGAVFPGQPNGNVGAWENLGSWNHGVGAIQRVGVSVRSSADNAYPSSLTLLSYTET